MYVKKGGDKENEENRIDNSRADSTNSIYGNCIGSYAGTNTNTNTSTDTSTDTSTNSGILNHSHSCRYDIRIAAVLLLSQAKGIGEGEIKEEREKHRNLLGSYISKEAEIAILSSIKRYLLC